MGSIELRPRHVGVGTFVATPRMKELVMEVLDSGCISYGEKSKQFERQFAELHGCKYAVLSNSGTSSLQVALQALMEENRWRAGSYVIVPATTFVATANIVRHCNLVPLFVDIDPDTYNMNPYLLEEMIDRYDPVALIPVHLFGQPANMLEISRIAANKDIAIVEDSCETMFARHHNKPVGSWGDVACFSTYVAHLVVTGVGGIATTNSPEIAARMRSLVNHGINIKNLNPDDNFSPQPMIGRRFEFTTYGHSYRITEMEAALGLAQLEDHRDILGGRMRNARHLSAGISHINRNYGNPIHPYTVLEENTCSFMMYPIVLETRPDGSYIDKTRLCRYLNDHQIETRDMLPILGQPIYRWLDPEDFPVSNWVLQSGFYVGCHQNLNPDDIDYVIQTLESYFNE